MNESSIIQALQKLKRAQRPIGLLTPEKTTKILEDIATLTIQQTQQILIENQKDLDRMDPNNPKYDRLLLNEERLNGIAEDIKKVAYMDPPLGKIIDQKTLPNDLQLQKITVPMGTIGIVFESRPNVTFDVFALCFKSGNATVLKGSRDAHFSNLKIVSLLHQVLADHQVPNAVFLAPSERSSLPVILEAVDFIDVIIPRGGQGLIDFVRQNAKVPVIETGAGIVHTYVDQGADLRKAQAIIKNAKTRRVSVCNALDTLIIHQSHLQDLPTLCHDLDRDFNLTIYADEEAFPYLDNHYQKELLHQALPEHFGTEFLSMKMAIKTVKSLEEAMDHIELHSSKHSESIVSEDENSISQFLNGVDAAVVYANTSTAFTDGAQFGMGAEIGISTQKLHARGPMALQELTSYKWVVRGNGQVRP